MANDGTVGDEAEGRGEVLPEALGESEQFLVIEHRYNVTVTLLLGDGRYVETVYSIGTFNKLKENPKAYKSFVDKTYEMLKDEIASL